MFVTAVQIPDFNPDRSKAIIGALGEIHGRMKGSHVPGFQKTLLLRKEDQSAILMTFWRTRLDMEKFISSPVGTKISELMSGLLTEGVKLEEYHATWEAAADEPISPRRIKN